jgi:hypothetical protein
MSLMTPDSGGVENGSRCATGEIIFDAVSGREPALFCQLRV